MCALAPASAWALKISELRLRGPSGPADEFIELYNESASVLTVNSPVAGASGFGVAASDGVLRCTIPNGTVIQPGGHFLCANAGYSLANYGGTGAAAPNASYTNGIGDNAGVALFDNNVGGAGYSPANRLDAAGSSSEPDTLYREGAGYTPVAVADANFSLLRVPGGDGLPRDTGENASDFRAVAADANASLPTATLGAPGPETLSSPRSRGSSVAVGLLAPCSASTAPPNQVRDLSTGTLTLRRKITNNTGDPITRLRLRITDLSTSPSPDPATAALAAVTSGDASVPEPCTPSTVPVKGVTLETPPAQPSGGGNNSSLSVSLGTPLANGSSVNVNLVFNVVQAGDFRVCANVEALPAGASNALLATGDTEGGSFSQSCPPPFGSPANTALPAIAGTPDVGAVLTGSDGTWTGTDLIFTRQWRRCDAGGGNCVDIAGATGPTYTVTATDIGATLRYAVTARNDGGSSTAESAPSALVPGGPGGGDGGGADTLAPVLLSASVTNRVFAVNRRGASEVGIARAKRGTTFLYALSEDATVVFTLRRARPGRRVGGKCRKPTRAIRKRRRCTRYVRRGRFAVPSTVGANRHRFSGKIDGRSLRRGTYRARLVATDAAGNASSARRVEFRIVRP